ncbi:MAG: hypothetical protein J6P74_06895 [Paludibacteraceae bacterium]|nr:hypothetical protein [Paludibacteraceae bacterium]
MRGLGERRLYEFRQLYDAYPQLGEQVLPFVLKISKKDILRLPTAISDETTDAKTAGNCVRLVIDAN